MDWDREIRVLVHHQAMHDGTDAVIGGRRPGGGHGRAPGEGRKGFKYGSRGTCSIDGAHHRVGRLRGPTQGVAGHDPEVQGRICVEPREIVNRIVHPHRGCDGSSSCFISIVDYHLVLDMLSAGIGDRVPFQVHKGARDEGVHIDHYGHGGRRCVHDCHGGRTVTGLLAKGVPGLDPEVVRLPVIKTRHLVGGGHHPAGGIRAHRE
jgi:hypothetical protein